MNWERGMKMFAWLDTPARSLELRSTCRVDVLVDGKAISARLGETVLTALRINVGHLHAFDFAPEARAGFCQMSACQDCWLWRLDGTRLRACTSLVETGLELSTMPPEQRQ
jgi:predicted molibdopterin-dependent oxidoreductase YjgC